MFLGNAKMLEFPSLNFLPFVKIDSITTLIACCPRNKCSVINVLNSRKMLTQLAENHCSGKHLLQHCINRVPTATQGTGFG